MEQVQRIRKGSKLSSLTQYSARKYGLSKKK